MNVYLEQQQQQYNDIGVMGFGSHGCGYHTMRNSAINNPHDIEFFSPAIRFSISVLLTLRLLPGSNAFASVYAKAIVYTSLEHAKC